MTPDYLFQIFYNENSAARVAYVSASSLALAIQRFEAYFASLEEPQLTRFITAGELCEGVYLK